MLCSPERSRSVVDGHAECCSVHERSVALACTRTLLKYVRAYCAGVTANPVLPHTGPPGTDPLAESIPRNESASIFDPPQDHIR